MKQLRIGEGNAILKYDINVERISWEQLERNMDQGKYGKPRPDYVRGWWKEAGRE